MDRQEYISYLLRLWRDGTGAPVWRASLENPRTVERQVFSDLESLFIFLQDKCSGTSSTCADGEDNNST
ncbi:MAG: hypothetical protein M1319_00730 [Chloroflexi bacterium]|nr:hypothetical protein [Chloroflexota bacterium]